MYAGTQTKYGAQPHINGGDQLTQAQDIHCAQSQQATGVIHMKALFFGSIGVLTETSELQRQAFNIALEKAGLDLRWNIATYCHHLRVVGGRQRLAQTLDLGVDDPLIDQIHQHKQDAFEALVATQQITPRRGIADVIARARADGLRLAFVTTTTSQQLALIGNALSAKLDLGTLDLVTSKADVTAEKPDSEVYHVALQRLGLAADEVIAIEDTEMNQAAAIGAGIDCRLFAGEYATVTRGDRQIHDAMQVLQGS